MKAIASLENARDIYAGVFEEYELELVINDYGIALSVYAMGYIYMNFSEQLVFSNKHKCRQKDHKYLVASEAESRKLACKYFKEAYEHFDEVGHLMGKAMCKYHEKELKE